MNWSKGLSLFYNDQQSTTYNLPNLLEKPWFILKYLVIQFKKWKSSSVSVTLNDNAELWSLTLFQVQIEKLCTIVSEAAVMKSQYKKKDIYCSSTESLL